MMSNGETEIVYNPSERAISDDQNRAQRFRGADLNELLRALVDTDCGTDDSQASSLDAQTVAQLSPVSGTVFNGLVVRPQTATMNLLVDAGVAGLYDPDAPPNPDESQFKVIRDPGVASGTPLVLAANGGGGTRIDVVECARVAGGFLVVETDNRDIFNPVTGLFTAATVNKVIQGRLQYRIRQGASGGGFPGTAAGWMPLCVVAVPTGAPNVGGCTFWDVRPFAGDRVLAPYRLAAVVPRVRRNLTRIQTSGGAALLFGSCEASATDTTGSPGGSYRLGGAYGGDVDFNLAANQSGAIGANGPAYVYLLEPFGLPRWARYTVQGSALAPAYRGIPVLSNTRPSPTILAPSAALALPAATGLGGTTTKAVAIAATSVVASVCSPILTDAAGMQQCGDSAAFTPVVGALVGTAVQFAMAGGTNYPFHATGLLVHLECDFTVNASASGGFVNTVAEVLDFGFAAGPYAAQALGTEIFVNFAGSGTGMRWNRTIRIPVPGDGAFGIQLLTNAVNMTLGTCVATVVGWEVG